jgi:hypothetical protein
LSPKAHTTPVAISEVLKLATRNGSFDVPYRHAALLLVRSNPGPDRSGSMSVAFSVSSLYMSKKSGQKIHKFSKRSIFLSGIGPWRGFFWDGTFGMG